MPAVFRGASFRKTFTATLTEQLCVSTRIPVEFKFKFRSECPLTVSTAVNHTSRSAANDYNVTDTKP